MDRSKEIKETADKIKEMDAVVKSIKRRIKKHPEEKGLPQAKGQYYEKQFYYLRRQTSLLNDFISHENEDENYGEE